MATDKSDFWDGYVPEPAYTFKPTSKPIIGILDIKPNYNMTFHRVDKQVGVLDFNGPEMTFTGDADESAKLFFDFIARSFKARLEQERADERNSWPSEMEAMERQVNILTDALAEERKSRANSLGPGEMELSLRRNHKDELFECRRRFSAEEVMHGPDFMVEATAYNLEVEMDRAIREWSNT